MRFEFYADIGKLSCRACNTAVKRHLTMAMKLEGKKSLQFHANKQQYDMNLGLFHKSFELSLPLKIIFTATKSLYSRF